MNRADRQRLRRALRRRLGHDRHADAPLDHAADRIEPVQAHPQLERTAGAGSVGREMRLQRPAVAEADQRLVQHLPERDAAPLRQGMARRHGEHDPIEKERPGFERAEIGRVGDDAEIGKPTRQSIDGLAAGALLEIDVDAGIGRKETGQRIGQEGGDRRGDRQQPDMTAQALAYWPSSPRICSSWPSTSRA